MKRALFSVCLILAGCSWNNPFLETNPNFPAPDKPLGQIEAGFQHNFYINPAGELWAWGSNSQGELGLGTTSAYEPLTRVSAFEKVSLVAAGQRFSIVKTSDGKVWAWGANTYGQLGKGDTISSVTPVEIPELFNAQWLDAGTEFAIAVMPDGTVKTWGRDNLQQLGNGPGTGNVLTPATIGGIANVTKIKTAYSHTLAQTTGGSIYGWGGNYIAFGLAFDADVTVPALLPLSNIADFDAGGQGFSLFMTSEGRLTTVGGNQFGQLGNGNVDTTYNYYNVPTLENFKTIIAGLFQSIAVKKDGKTFLAGANNFAQMLEAASDQHTFFETTLLSNVAQADSFSATILVLKNDGSVWAWGANDAGQCADGTTTHRDTPNKVISPIY